MYVLHMKANVELAFRIAKLAIAFPLSMRCFCRFAPKGPSLPDFSQYLVNNSIYLLISLHTERPSMTYAFRRHPFIRLSMSKGCGQFWVTHTTLHNSPSTIHNTNPKPKNPKAPATQHFHVKHISSTTEICLPPPPATMTTALATSAAGAIASSCVAVAGGAISPKSNNNVAMSFGNSHFFSSSTLSLQSSSAVVNVQRPTRRTNLIVCGKVSGVLEAFDLSRCPGELQFSLFTIPEQDKCMSRTKK